MTGKKILIAAEHAETADWKKHMLARSEFVIFTASTTVEALEIHRRERVNLMVIDLELHKPYAEQLCRDIRADEEDRNVSIIAVGTFPVVEAARFSQCGANAFLEKPIDFELFQQTISRLIDVFPRMNCRALFQGKVTGHQGTEDFFAYSENLSRSGILIRTRYPMKRGDFFECSFVLPGSGEVSVRAEVVRVRDGSDGEFLYGSRFVMTSDRDMQHIDIFLKKEND